jgi:hypothetical protein
MDSAVLAAANLEQQLDSADVIRSYFDKHGFDPDVVDIDVQSTDLGGGEVIARSVSADYPIDTDTIFMGLLGIDTLSGTATGAAAQRRQNAEISLVLDISGSMRFSDKIGSLRTAVEEFLQTILDVECDNLGNCIQAAESAGTTISIVPYAGHVNPGADLFQILGAHRWHGWSSCKEVDEADFDSMDLPRNNDDQIAHFMKWQIDQPTMNWGWCPDQDTSIMAMENDYQTLSDFVRDMRLHDGTATHIGLLYGLALLNPSSRDEIAQLADRGVVADAYRTRPSNWDTDVKKYVIVMTDGQTTNEFRPRYQSPTQNGWRDFDYSLIPDDFDYARFAAEAYERPEEANGNGNGNGNNGNGKGNGGTGDGGTDPAPTFEYNPTLHPDFGAILDTYGSVASDRTINTTNDVESFYPGTHARVENGLAYTANRNNTAILDLCAMAKAPVYAADGTLLKGEHATVFTIAFQAPGNARAIMEECATSQSHFYNVQDLDIESAFESISRTIQNLRLTQ